MRLHINNVNSGKLHELLMKLDGETARSLHPNQCRKIIRAVEVSEQEAVGVNKSYLLLLSM